MASNLPRYPQPPRAPRVTLERALLVQISILSTIVMACAAAFSAYYSIKVEQTRLAEGVVNRLSGYHEVLSEQLEDANFDAAKRVGNLIAQEQDIRDFRIKNRFDKVIAERGMPDEAGPGWDRITLSILSDANVEIGVGTYLVRKPTIRTDAMIRIAAVSVGMGSLFALFAIILFQGLKSRFLEPIRELHHAVASAPRDGFNPGKTSGAPIEIAELAEAFDQTYHGLERSLVRNERHVAVITRLLSGFGVAIRYCDTNGNVWDYGRVKPELMPCAETHNEDHTYSHAREKLKNFAPEEAQVRKLPSPSNGSEHGSFRLEVTDAHSVNEVTLFDLGSDGFAFLIANVTEAREIERSALELQRMETIGKLSSGIAHDFNNTLGVILSNADLLSTMVQDPELEEMLASIILACERGASLTKSLLTFAREMHLEDQVFDLNSVVTKVAKWSGRVLPETIHTDVVLARRRLMIRADPNLTENAILNLLLNSRDAMPEGGALTIRTEALTLTGDKPADFQGAIPPGEYVVLTVRDSGIGISQTDLNKIFEPFFTSKSRDQGSGLGLAMVHGFISQTGGFVRVSSQVNIGTTFKLYFPAERAEAILPSQKPEGPAPTQGARILLVEDETLLRLATQKHLEAVGYQVTSAEHGPGALAAIADGNGVDIVVTDMVMPGAMTGQDLVARLRETNPTLPAVYVSGYETTSRTDAPGGASDTYLIKPVKFRDLVAAIEAGLRANAQRG